MSDITYHIGILTEGAFSAFETSGAAVGSTEFFPVPVPTDKKFRSKIELIKDEDIDIEIKATVLGIKVN